MRKKNFVEKQNDVLFTMDEVEIHKSVHIIEFNGPLLILVPLSPIMDNVS